ncbi:hypothetical protein Tco_0451030 [Tanacetum coccineum]
MYPSRSAFFSSIKASGMINVENAVSSKARNPLDTWSHVIELALIHKRPFLIRKIFWMICINEPLPAGARKPLPSVDIKEFDRFHVPSDRLVKGLVCAEGKKYESASKASNGSK